jgi:molybdopterin-guanine dinucleotide biosynthesis protein A
MRPGAIILCGGKSSRMGREKATLPFGPELMLQRVVRLIGEVIAVENTVVVAAPSQLLPSLPNEVLIVHDPAEYLGPLAGLATGLRVLADRVDAVYATGCDVPLLVPAFVERMFDLLGDHDAAVPFDGEHYHSLAAVYRASVLTPVEAMLNVRRLRSRDLFREVRARTVSLEELRDVDPRLSTIENLNHARDYQAALMAAGYAT